MDGPTDDLDFEEDYTVYLISEADDIVIAVEGADTVDLSEVYYVAGVYGSESSYNKGNITYYAQAVSLADGTISNIKLDKDDAKNALKNYFDKAGTWKEVQDFYTFDDDVATLWRGGDDYQIYGIGGNATLTRKLTNELTMDATRFTTDTGDIKTFYVDGSTQYLGVEKTADDIETVYAVGGVKADTKGNVVVITNAEEHRDALYVVLVDASASIGSSDILYVANNISEKVGKGEYVGDFWFMGDNSSDELTVDDDVKKGFWKVDSIDEDGVYTLVEYKKNATSVDEDTDDEFVMNLDLSATTQIYRDALSGTIDSVKFDDISIADATIIDARSASDRESSVYDREINSIARLEAALEAATKSKGDDKTVTIDLYVKDGEITFICVQSVGKAVEEDDSTKETSVSGVDDTFNVSEENANDTALRATILAQENGVYQVLGDIPDNCANVPSNHLVYFVTTNDVAGSGYTLTIFDEDGVVVYTETYAGNYGAGKVMAYVNIAAGTDGDTGSGSGEYVSKDFAPGTYDFVFTCGTTPTRGSFTVE